MNIVSIVITIITMIITTITITYIYIYILCHIMGKYLFDWFLFVVIWFSDWVEPHVAQNWVSKSLRMDWLGFYQMIHTLIVN